MLIRRITHSSIARTLVTLVTSACMAGTAPVVIGVAGGSDTTSTGTSARVLDFFTQPGNADVGQGLGVITVVARDSLGNVDTTFDGVVQISLASNSTGGGLRGVTAVRALDGIASFNNLAIDAAGTYTLRARATGAGTATSVPFTITTITTP
jgi:hypothetical protein